MTSFTYCSTFPFKRSTEGSAGFDLHASADITLKAGKRATIGTDLCVNIPNGWVGLIRGRSGLAFKNDIYVFHGTIDSDYHDEIKMRIENRSNTDKLITIGSRIAQLVVVQHFTLKPKEISKTNMADTTHKGFGSTGK